VKYSIITFGCRVNQADSFRIEEELRRLGAEDATPDQADLVVVNSCSVTAAADQGARQTIRRIVRGNPDVKVVVTGCYASRRPDDLRQLSNVVRVIPNERKDSLVALLEAEGELTTAQRFDGDDGPCGMMLQPGVAGRTALTLRVQTGCDEHCSYCIIPSTRGAGQSHPLSGVLQDIRRAVAAGYREIAITGVHLGSYGRDLGDGTTLTDLVSVLASWREEVLFRISSLEPMDCTPDIVRLASESSRIAPHFHLPLQHGCDDMLTAMRRPYSAADYGRLVETIRGSIQHASIGTDLIVGFPGETDAHFDEMVRFVEALPLSYLHVFPYSDRPGTAATRLPRKVDGDTIRTRGRVLRAIGTAKAAAFRATQSGRTVRALTVDDGRSAVTENYLKVQLQEQRPRNTWITVTL
jgi:threonylcarbamoyladenosine tRNA methylthiotransferase MtaB